MGVSAPKGSRGRSESPLVASAEAIPLLHEKSSNHRRFPKGDRRLRLFSLPFGRLRRGEIPAFREKPFTIGKNSYSVAPIWRDNMQVVGRAAWGRVCGRAKLLAGTLRCLHLCWRLPWDWSDAEQLGRCPKPHKGRCPLTLQGADEKGRSPPLDPFLAPQLERFSLTGSSSTL